MRKDLERLLGIAYDKGQAMYNKDHFASGDDDQEWDACYEEGYQDAIYEFLEKYRYFGEGDNNG